VIDVMRGDEFSFTNCVFGCISCGISHIFSSFCVNLTNTLWTRLPHSTTPMALAAAAAAVDDAGVQ